MISGRGIWHGAVMMVAAAASCATRAQAQHMDGLVAEVAVEGMRTAADALGTVSGPGLNALLGYGVTSYSMVLLNAGFGFAESRVLAHAGLCGRLYGPRLARVAPFAELVPVAKLVKLGV
jgi:hypothetical protein